MHNKVIKMPPKSTILITLASVLGLCVGVDFCENAGRSEEIESFTNGANDVVVVVQPDNTLRATDFHVQGWVSIKYNIVLIPDNQIILCQEPCLNDEGGGTQMQM